MIFSPKGLAFLGKISTCTPRNGSRLLPIVLYLHSDEDLINVAIRPTQNDYNSLDTEQLIVSNCILEIFVACKECSKIKIFQRFILFFFFTVQQCSHERDGRILGFCLDLEAKEDAIFIVLLTFSLKKGDGKNIKSTLWITQKLKRQ